MPTPHALVSSCSLPMQKPPRMTILTLCDNCHLVSTSCRVVPSTMQKSPCVTILTSRGNCHLASTLGDQFPTSHRHSHITSISCDHILTSQPPHETIFYLCGHSHLVSTPHALMSSCPLHHAKVTLCDHSHLMWQFSSHVYLACSPPHKNNIFHLAWKNSQKKVMQQPRSINKAPLMSHQ